MAITQIGYFYGNGPMFRDDSPGGGKYILMQGGNLRGDGVFGLYAKQPSYATNLGLNASEYTLGSYTDNQYVGVIPAHQMPADGASGGQGYVPIASGWVTGGLLPGQTSTSPTQPTTTGGGGTTTTGGGGTTTTGGGATTTSGGGGTTTTDTTYSSPTVTEQITTFLKSYWWIVALVIVALLWKSTIAPALGLGKRKRAYR